MRLLILGIGNLLMGDEGIGVHVVRHLERQRWPVGVTIVDGGTGGFHLLSFLQDFDPVILIDATADDQAPGTVSVIQPRYASDFPPSLSAHDIGLKDLIESAALLGRLPTVHLVTVSIDTPRKMTLAVTPDVEAAIPAVGRVVEELVRRLTSHPTSAAATAS